MPGLVVLIVALTPGCVRWGFQPFSQDDLADSAHPADGHHLTDGAHPADGGPWAGASEQGSTPPPLHVWSKRLGGSGDDDASSVAVDSSGNVFLTGAFRNTADFGGIPLTSAGDADIFLASYTTSGVHRFSKSFGGTAVDEGASVAVDASGNVFLTGSFENKVNFGGGALPNAGDADVFLASYTTSGVHRFSKSFGGVLLDYGSAVAVDASGNVYLTGSYRETVDFGGGPLDSTYWEIFLASYTTLGVHRSSKRLGGDGWDSGHALAVDASGNVYLTGDFSDTMDLGSGPFTAPGGFSDIFLASYTAAGGHRFSKSFGGPGTDLPKSLALDASGNIYTTGFFEDTVDFGGGPLTSAGNYDLYLASHTAAGVHRFSKRFGGALDDHGWAVAVDSAGHVYLAGSFQSTVDFGGGPLTSAGGTDIILASYTGSGGHRFSARFGGAGADFGSALAVDASGNVFLAGRFAGTLAFGSAALVSSGPSDGFLAKLTPK